MAGVGDVGVGVGGGGTDGFEGHGEMRIVNVRDAGGFET